MYNMIHKFEKASVNVLWIRNCKKNC